MLALELSISKTSTITMKQKASKHEKYLARTEVLGTRSKQEGHYCRSQSKNSFLHLNYMNGRLNKMPLKSCLPINWHKNPLRRLLAQGCIECGELGQTPERQCFWREFFIYRIVRMPNWVTLYSSDLSMDVKGVQNLGESSPVRIEC